MTKREPTRLEPERIEALYREHARELRYFLLGMVHNADLADEFLHATYVKVMEVGHKADPTSIKGWLFRVAQNEVQTFWRRRKIGDKVNQAVAENQPRPTSGPETHAVRSETVAAVRAELAQLPEAQRQVVTMRIYEGKKFIEIAEQLGLPLGTVLTRMRLAQKKLQAALADEFGGSEESE